MINYEMNLCTDGKSMKKEKTLPYSIGVIAPNSRLNLHVKAKFSGLTILLYFLIFVFLFSGCSVKEKSVSVPVDTTKVFSTSGTVEAPEKWWTTFNDQELNVLIDSALESNFNLKTAWQRLQAAEAVVKRESSSLFPTIEANAGSNISKYQTQFIQDFGYELGLRSGYEIDLWGRIGSHVEAERYRAKASKTDYQAAALSLSAEITRTWYRLIEARNHLELVKSQVATNKKMLSLMEARFGSGQVRSADILRQRQLLESTKEQKINAEIRLQLIENQLSVLLGDPPQEKIDQIKDSLPQMPPLPETGVPADLVRRRPDVQSAFNILQAADREVAAAISNQYPRFSISASASTSADNVEKLFKDWAYSLAGNLMAPIFYGGRLNAEVDRTEAVKKQRLYTYGQTILNAFQEVEDALVQEKKQKEKIKSIKKQLDLARQTYEQLRVEYFNGMGGYLDVLTALNEVQQLRRSLLTANLTLLEYRITLYRSIAGGFDTQRSTES
jgi:NodT family efflux transporter outer membrane factor (OMF) lipoprotein